MGDFGRYYDINPRWGYDYYEMEDRYENYAFRGFENYNIIEDRRNKWYYNQFGDRLTKMTRNARIWAEIYNDDGSSEVSRSSEFINSQLPIYVGWDKRQPTYGHDGIWVARESTDDWALSIVGAGALRTKLTPLTLNYPNLPGMKADFQSANFEASIVNSNLAGRGSPGDDPFLISSNFLLVRGGQLRRKFGALTIGASYANMYAVQPNRDKGDSWKGTVNNFTPTPMYYAVRIMDDSPHDGDGPIVHDVKIKVDGVYRPDIHPQIILDDYSRELVTAVTSEGQKNYANVPEWNSQISEMLGGRSAPFTQLTQNILIICI